MLLWRIIILVSNKSLKDDLLKIQKFLFLRNSITDISKSIKKKCLIFDAITYE